MVHLVGSNYFKVKKVLRISPICYFESPSGS